MIRDAETGFGEVESIEKLIDEAQTRIAAQLKREGVDLEGFTFGGESVSDTERADQPVTKLFHVLRTLYELLEPLAGAGSDYDTRVMRLTRHPAGFEQSQH